ncbi:MAG: SCO family protein [Bacteroidota bacterium]
MNSKILYFLFYSFMLSACTQEKIEQLPYIGFHQVNGKDTIHYTIPAFTFYNQDSLPIDNNDLSGSIYLADFFYTSCPSVCPKVQNQLLYLYDHYEKKSKVKFISFALDPKRDDVANLKDYADNIGASDGRWHFLTGDKFKLWELAEAYLISVRQDEEEPGGIYHSGKIILVDELGHIRAFADGTKAEEVEDLIAKIDLLLSRKE